MSNEKSRTATASARDRRAEMTVPHSDTRSPVRFLEHLMQGRVRDAWLLGDSAGAGRFLAGAAEAAEFGLGDTDRAFVLQEQAAEHPDADPRAFGGLRRRARRDGDPAAVTVLYEREFERAGDDLQRAWAGLGAARLALRHTQQPADVLALLDALQPIASDLSREVQLAIAAARSEALDVLGRPAEAHRLRARLWGEEAEILGEEGDRFAASAALAIAAAAEHHDVDAGDAALDWYGVSLEAEATADALRPLVRDALDQDDAATAEALLSDAVSRLDDPAERGRAQVLLGQLRAWKLGDRPGALQAWGEALRGGDSAPVAAASYLSVARGLQGSLDSADAVEALGARLELAASNVERADLLTRMGLALAKDARVAQTVIDLAQEAIREDPAHLAARRLLDDALDRSGDFEAQARHLEEWIGVIDAPVERIRLRLRLARLSRQRLQRTEDAESCLRAILDDQPNREAIELLAELLESQGRHVDLVDHLVTAAEQIGSPRERGNWLVRAATVAQHELRNGDLAAELLATLIERYPQHSAAVGQLASLLERQSRHEERLALLEAEFTQFESDPGARAAVACQAASICLGPLGDPVAAESWWRTALREQAGHPRAIAGLVDLCAQQQRHDDVAQLLEQALRTVVDDRERAPTLLRLAELYAVDVGNLERARECFVRLRDSAPRHRELALIWLERIHEAEGDAESTLAVLRERHATATDPQSGARLAWRIASLLEFAANEPAEAFEGYLESLGEPVCTGLAVDALDRLWTFPGLDSAVRKQCVAVLEQVADSVPELRHRVLRLLAERLVDDAEKRLEFWTTIADEWPGDVVAGEVCAQHALAFGEVAAADGFRSTNVRGALHALLVEWSSLEQGCASPQTWEGVGLQPLRSLLALEFGRWDVAFAGADERELFARISAGSVTVGELLQGTATDVERRLAIHAARALGRQDDLASVWLQHVDALDTPVLRLQALLDLAEDPLIAPEVSRRALVEAAGLGLHEHPLRRDLYDRLEAARENDALASAIREHLTVVRDLDAAVRVGLALRGARSLVSGGHVDEAVIILRDAAVHVPADARIALEKARLEAGHDLLDDARETLESCLDGGVPGAERIAVLGRLAELHERRGGDMRRAISCLEDACTLSDNAPAQALRLAHAHARGGNPQRAAGLLSEALQGPPETNDLHHWLLLARLRGERLGDVEGARSLLWELFRLFPESEEVLAGLEDHHRHLDDAGAFAGHLAQLLLEGTLDDAPDRATDLWVYVGELNATVLTDWRRAEEAFGHARRGRPDSADIRLREARAIARQPDRGADALRRLLDMLSLPDVSNVIWEQGLAVFEDACEQLQDGARLRIVRQARAALAGQRVRGAAAATPQRTMERAVAWHLLGRDHLPQGHLDALQQATALGERVFADRLPDRRQIGAARFRAEQAPLFSDALEQACAWLDAAPPRIWVVDGGERVQPLDNGNVVVPRDLCESDDEAVLQHLAGVAAAQAWLGTGIFLHAGDGGICELWQAIAGRVLGDDTYRDAMLGEEIGGILLAGARRQAAQALRDAPEVVERHHGWVQALVAFSDRVGLLCCGDLSASVAVIRQTAGAREAEQRISDLLRFALSDRFEQARFEVGAARRPLPLEAGV